MALPSLARQDLLLIADLAVVVSLDRSDRATVAMPDSGLALRGAAELSLAAAGSCPRSGLCRRCATGSARRSAPASLRLLALAWPPPAWRR